MTIESSNISFGQGSSGAQSIETIPLRMLVVADLSREGRGVGEEAPAQTFRVDKDSYDALFGKLNPRLLFEAPNVLVPKGDPIVADLEFTSLKDFEGPAVAAKIPALAALQKLREDIAAQAAPDDTADALAAKIQNLAAGIPFANELVSAVQSAGGGAAPKAATEPAKPSAAKSGGSSVDSILDMMEEDSGEAQQAKAGATEAAIGSVISSMFKTSKPGPSKGQQNALAAMHAWFDVKIGKQLDEILHHPDFQSIEEAWRGLRLLIGRTDFRKEIVVEVLAARKQDLRRVLIEQVLQEEFDSAGDPPLAVVICDAAFDNGIPDIDLLNEIAAKCESIQAPFVAQTAPEFFGRKILQGLGGQGSLFSIFQGEGYVKWRALRAKDEARWIALTTNRMLLRHPSKGGTQGKSYPEAADEGKGAGLLWGSSVWALAACMTRSFANEGWPHFLSGPRGGGAVEDLPLRTAEVRAGKTTPTPLEAVFSESQGNDLASNGLIPLQANEGSDMAYFTFLPVVFAPKSYSNPKATQEAALHAILPYQLFAGRMSLWLGRLLGPLRGGSTGEEIQQKLEQGLRAILAKPGESPEATKVRVEVSDDEKNPMRYQVCMEIQPSFKFFGLTPRLLLAVSVPR